MKNVSRSISTVVLLAALSACGGGGGGESGGSTPAPDQSWLQFSPSAVSIKAYETEGAKVSIKATSSKIITETIRVAVIDATGVFSPYSDIINNGDLSYTANLAIAAELRPGTHTGNLEVRVCRDDPKVCGNPYPGSPWKVPYSITIRSNINLTPLVALSGAVGWSTFQGNSARNGYVEATLDPSKFIRRFRSAKGFDQVVADRGQVCGLNSFPALEKSLACIDENSSQLRWTNSFPSYTQAGSPTLVAGKLFYFADIGTGTTLFTVDANDGRTLLAKRADGDPAFMPPIVEGGGVFSNDGRGYRTSRVDAATGIESWRSGDGYLRFGAPAVVNGKVVALTVASVVEHDADTGAKLSEVMLGDAAGETGGMAYYTAVVLDNSDAAFVCKEANPSAGRAGYLTKIDRKTKSIAWSVSDANILGSPVVVKDVVYIRTQDGLQARSSKDGTLLWKWSSGRGTYLPHLLVVGHHAFFSVADGTVAVDLNTRQEVWRDRFAGPLAVSPNGVLYISESSGLVAINLH